MKYIEIKYFQKSQALLYPLLELATAKTETFSPKEVYCFFEHHGIEDGDLILLYENINSFFLEYEAKKLIKHTMLKTVYETDKGNVYVFNLRGYKNETEFFLGGEYSKFSDKAKKIILKYYNDITEFGKLLDNRPTHTILYPDFYREAVAKELQIGIEYLPIELAPLYDLEKETLYATVKERAI
jgi:hypothetical protein